ncbi:unnamed protein product [Urochloa decumbens]|uniref:Uncharacterized protein n=1 Tax=Urochloa decumbens TaxID=240449 RepID=A0ABC9DG68_9POAL
MAVSHLRAALYRVLRSPSPLPAPSRACSFAFLHYSSAAASSSGSFAVEDYLVSRCGLTHAQALKAAAKLSHLRSPAKPDSVLAYLEGTLSIPAADISRVVAIDPTFLCADVEKTLAPRVADLLDLGMSPDEIAILVPLAPNSFRIRFLRRNLEFWLAELGSFDKLLLVLRSCSSLLSLDLDKVARPNVAFLRQCGLDISEIAGKNVYSNRLLTLNSELLKESVQRVEELGIQRGAKMFRYMLIVFCFTDKEIFARRIRLLHNLGFTKDDVQAIVRKYPLALGFSEQKVQENVEFLVKEVGLELSYIVQRPALLTYSVERRLLPRHCLLKVLREKGLLKREPDYYATATRSEKIFVEKFVHPFENNIPGLADDYASRCLGMAWDD